MNTRVTSKKNAGLRHRLASSEIRAIDLAFAEFIAEQYATEPTFLADIAAHLSFQSGLQHVCVSLFDMHAALDPSVIDIDDLVSYTQASPAILCLSDRDCDINNTINHPIIYQGGAFYLQRYWVHETSLICHLCRLSAQKQQSDHALIGRLLGALFPTADDVRQEIDWQKVAVAVAALNPISFITGGPGTGKTTTVVRLIALLQQMKRQQENRRLKIKLAAPTGKAAARLSDSIAMAISSLPASLSDGLEIRSTTIHRLLGANYQSIHFSHDSRNPIHADLIILDEASMIDLPMMSRFFAAVPSGCRVVFL